MYKIPLLALLFISGLTFAQKDASLLKNGLPKDAKIITLTSDLDKDALFSAVGKILFENSYELKSSDKNIGTIQTDNHIVKGSIRIRLSISVENNEAKIRGRVIVPGAIDEDLTNAKGANGIFLLAFTEMDRVAKLIPHSKIEYLP